MTTMDNYGCSSLHLRWDLPSILHAVYKLVGGFNPSEKYESQWEGLLDNPQPNILSYIRLLIKLVIVGLLEWLPFIGTRWCPQFKKVVFLKLLFDSY